ncbi:merozoite surface antigen 2-like [Zingiber officinale]|uniref:merozoite surface antigen 2-like n=1 Tax=Zingiber officinale TaxID=94328 RepID=UPI001C4ADAFC|nr:merozoite surface antigen 2-like [Zingiber officinale]
MVGGGTGNGATNTAGAGAGYTIGIGGAGATGAGYTVGPGGGGAGYATTSAGGVSGEGGDGSAASDVASGQEPTTEAVLDTGPEVEERTAIDTVLVDVAASSTEPEAGVANTGLGAEATADIEILQQNSVTHTGRNGCHWRVVSGSAEEARNIVMKTASTSEADQMPHKFPDLSDYDHSAIKGDVAIVLQLESPVDTIVKKADNKGVQSEEGVGSAASLSGISEVDDSPRSERGAEVAKWEDDSTRCCLRHWISGSPEVADSDGTAIGTIDGCSGGSSPI